MKSSIFSFLIVLVSAPGFSQNLNYEVRSAYTRPVKKEKLMKAETMSDIVSGYPSSWITDYVSAEITATCNGDVQKAMGPNDVLTTAQKNLLEMADLGTDVVLDINYKYKNSVTDQSDLRNLHISLTMVPEIEAEYLGGYELLKKYLKEAAIDKITVAESKNMILARDSVWNDPKFNNIAQAGDSVWNDPELNNIAVAQVQWTADLPGAGTGAVWSIVEFTIDEEGKVTNPHVTMTSGDQKIDKLLLRAIRKMSNWNPAESNGKKVKQEFLFIIGNAGC